jgi:hypothetical protein
LVLEAGLGGNALGWTSARPAFRNEFVTPAV